MDKLVLELAIKDDTAGLFRSTSIRIFDQKSLDATLLGIRAGCFGKMAKWRYFFRFVKGPRNDRMVTRFFRETGGLPVISVFEKHAPIMMPYDSAKGAKHIWVVRDSISHLFYDMTH
jgi:hypothetical protein